jgi:ribosomal protein S18 acetylase RimI-like enzyme
MPITSIRSAREDDYPSIAAALQTWWTQPGLGAAGARERAALVPRLWLQHFASTSLVATREDRLAGFLIGFLSPDRPGEGYIHFVGVAPDTRREGLGRRLYEHFFGICREAGRTRVRCITSPQNTLSVAFHLAMGFEAEPGTVGLNRFRNRTMRPRTACTPRCNTPVCCRSRPGDSRHPHHTECLLGLSDHMRAAR